MATRFALLLAKVAVVASVRLQTAIRVTAATHARGLPAVCMTATYGDYIKERHATEAQGDAPEAFGASSSLCNPEFVAAAKQAAELAGVTSFTASEIVISFNAWKLSLGLTYSDKEDEGLALCAFASDAALIKQYLQAADSAIFDTEALFDDTTDNDFDSSLNEDWRNTYDKAAEQRTQSEAQLSRASEGMAAAEEKLRKAMALTSQQEEEVRMIAQRAYKHELRQAEESASAERSRIAKELALVNAEEKEAREAAEKRLHESIDALQISSAKAIAAAQADHVGALHKWKGTVEHSKMAIKAAEADMSSALLRAREQATAAKAAAEKRAQATIAAQAEAKALLELLKQKNDETMKISARALEQKRELEAAVEYANKRARKAKLAAAAALEDL